MWILLANMLMGCVDSAGSGGDTADPCAPGSSPEAILGQGEFAFLPVDDGENRIELVHGPQGGFHITLALEARYLDASTPWLLDLVGSIDGVERGATRPYVEMRCNPAEAVLQGWGALLIWDAQPEDLHEQVADVEATITDSTGTVISAVESYTIFDPVLE